MKSLKWIVIAFVAVALGACNSDDLNPKSIFGDEDAALQNEFDAWLMKNYTAPYNLNFKYRLEDKESDTEYNLAPAEYSKAIALAKMTKYLWLETYEELLGPHFIREFCPKLMQLVGSKAYNSQGSVVLGTAEGGLKITLYNVNDINLTKIDIEMLNYWYFKTMHHEFAHILHQTKSYSTDFNLISPSNYQSSSWVNLREENVPGLGSVSKQALDLGFVSPYASSETQEDFVEIISIYITHTPEYWTKLVALANVGGREMINQKLALVRDYMSTTWGIDLDTLRDIVQRRSQEILLWDANNLVTLN